MPERIYVGGLRELRSALRATGNADHKDQVKQAGRKVAGEIVIPAARSNAAGVRHWQTGRSEMFTKAAATMKPATVAGGGGIRFGGGFAGSFGSEFGGIVWRQFNPWRGSGQGAGYFLWPAIRDETPRIREVYLDAIEEVFDANWMFL